MEAHVAAGNRAEALQVYEQCRRLLADELGAYPSPETESIYRRLLEAPSAPAEVTAVAGTPALDTASVGNGDGTVLAQDPRLDPPGRGVAAPTTRIRRRSAILIAIGVALLLSAAAGRGRRRSSPAEGSPG